MLRYTIIFLTLTSFTGIGLNILSNLIEKRQMELTKLTNLIELEVERIRILRTEWAFQTQPKRIQENIEKTLLIKSPGKDQFIKISELPMRTSAWKMDENVSDKQLIKASFASVAFLPN